MSIERYGLEEITKDWSSVTRMTPDPTGDYVTYADHAAELARVTAERDAAVGGNAVLLRSVAKWSLNQ